MPIEPVYLLYGGIFLAAFFLIEGIYFFYLDGVRGQRQANRRMRMLSTGATSEKVFHELRRSQPNQWDYLGALGAPVQWLNNLAARSGSALSIERLCVVMISLTALLFLALVVGIMRSPSVPLNNVSLVIAAILSAAVGVGAPIAYLSFLKVRRRKTFSEQLPDALDIMVRSLRVGHPVNVAMRITAEQMPDPIGTEFGIAVDEMVYGLELREALANIGQRVDQQDFQYVIVAIGIQHETGGNLADVLSGLASVIRSRFRMFKKIRALSAEGRFSAKILGALPFVFGFLTFSARPEYYLKVSTDPLFLKTMGVALLLQLIGMFIMHKLINFRI